MKQCPFCGSELNDDAKFCIECGKPLPEHPSDAAEAPEAVSAAAATAPYAAPAAPAAPVVPAASSQKASVEKPAFVEVQPKKQSLSTFQYILLSLLYGLPVIGFVFLFIFGAGHPKNGSLKRFSAAKLILRLVFWIVLLGLMIAAIVKNGRQLSDALGQLIPAVENLLKAIFA